MSLLDTLRKNLSPELFASVTDALGDDFNYDLVPRTRLNSVIGQRDKARRELERLTQGDIDPDDDDDLEDDDDGDEGTKSPKQKKAKAKGPTQKDLDAAVQAEKEKGEAALKNLQLKYAVTEKLRGANVVDPDMVLSAGLIDLSKVTTDEHGVITGGLDDQIAAVTKDRPYLVNKAGGKQTGTGKTGGSDDFGQVTSREEFLKLSTADQLKFKEANPEVFKGFMEGIY